MTTPEQYRKKTVEVEAMRLDRDNAKDICDWVGSASKGQVPVNYNASGEVLIGVNRPRMLALIGDYVVRDASGEFFPSSKSRFEAAYEATDSASEQAMSTRDEMLAAIADLAKDQTQFDDFCNALAPWLPDDKGVPTTMERHAYDSYDSYRGAYTYYSNEPLYRFRPSAVPATEEGEHG